jgi:hypothetical protein
MKRHIKYLKDYQLLVLDGFIDEDNIPLGNMLVRKDGKEYSKHTLNVFITKNYTIGNIPIFKVVMGPYLGTRYFIVVTRR